MICTGLLKPAHGNDHQDLSIWKIDQASIIPSRNNSSPIGRMQKSVSQFQAMIQNCSDIWKSG
jgi:hypothetical protein